CLGLFLGGGGGCGFWLCGLVLGLLVVFLGVVWWFCFWFLWFCCGWCVGWWLVGVWLFLVFWFGLGVVFVVFVVLWVGLFVLFLLLVLVVWLWLCVGVVFGGCGGVCCWCGVVVGVLVGVVFLVVFGDLCLGAGELFLGCWCGGSVVSATIVRRWCRTLWVLLGR
ncbi:hypothetical protein, partial [Pseudomonas syringae group genomosp. 7]|uniref:hypothetical protein n=1 Tax=Pseudomonas syringae group genomosp. 7 TaxID=251699 RepID=UPI00376F5861